MKNLISLIILNISFICYAPPIPSDLHSVMDEFNSIMIEYNKQLELERFKQAIAYRESRNNPLVVNQINCIGLYQFAPQTRKALGVPKINKSDIVYNHSTKRRYLKNAEIWPIDDQNKAMDELILINAYHLRHEIENYEGKIVNGILITKSGLLAAAHLGGYGSVKRFIRSGYDPKDINGTRITMYMKEFGGYEF